MKFGILSTIASGHRERTACFDNSFISGEFRKLKVQRAIPPGSGLSSPFL
jgi:hypothetical protein